MNEQKRIRIAAISFVLAFAYELIQAFVSIGERLHGLLWGLQFIFLLLAIGISVKLISEPGIAKTIKTKARIILLVATIQAVYTFIF